MDPTDRFAAVEFHYFMHMRVKTIFQILDQDGKSARSCTSARTLSTALYDTPCSVSSVRSDDDI